MWEHVCNGQGWCGDVCVMVNLLREIREKTEKKNGMGGSKKIKKFDESYDMVNNMTFDKSRR